MHSAVHVILLGQLQRLQSSLQLLLNHIRQEMTLAKVCIDAIRIRTRTSRLRHLLQCMAHTRHLRTMRIQLTRYDRLRDANMGLRLSCGHLGSISFATPHFQLAPPTLYEVRTRTTCYPHSLLESVYSPIFKASLLPVWGLGTRLGSKRFQCILVFEKTHMCT